MSGYLRKHGTRIPKSRIDTDRVKAPRAAIRRRIASADRDNTIAFAEEFIDASGDADAALELHNRINGQLAP